MAHGNHWEAIDSKYSEFIAEMLPRICQEGEVAGKNAFSHTLDDVPNKVGVAIGLRYLDTPLNFLALIVANIEPDSNLLWSAYPVCAEGISTRLEICEIKPWDNGVEGTITANIPEGGMISYFDPYYFLNKDQYRVGEEVNVSLSGLAYLLNKSDQLEIEITEGPMLEIHRQNLVKDDPTIDVSKIMSVPISMDGAAIYFPRGEDEDDAEVRFKVIETMCFKCVERSFVRLTGIIMRPDSGDVMIHVYASEEVLKGYVPQVGDNVEGFVWMQGYIV